jgi:WD40 repeat protein
VSAHQCIQTLAARTNGAWAGGIAWSPDGTTLANSADDGTIKLWETKTWKSVGELADKLSSGILSATALSWSPDSRTLYSGYWDHTVRVWDVQHLSGKWAMPEHASVVFGVAVSPNGNLLASGSRDGTVRIWDLVKATWPGDTLADFPKARWPQSPQCVHLFSGNDGVVNGVSWSPDGRFVASADEGEHVQVWDVSTGAWVISLTGHTGSITAVSWSPDGKWIASCGDDRTVRLWKVVNSGIQPGSQVTFWNFGITLTGHRAVVKSLAWSPDSKMLASGDMEGQINIWDIDYILSER